MLAFRVLVAFGETEIDDVNIVLSALVAANKEVIGLNIAMDDALFVHLLDAVNLELERTFELDDVTLVYSSVSLSCLN